MKGPKSVVIDKAYGDGELERLRLAAGLGDWPTMSGILDPVRERGDQERLTWLIANLDDTQAFRDRLEPLLERHPESVVLRSVVGSCHVGWAWQARTAARASRVSAEQFETFHKRLRVAEEHLYAAVELDPASPVPWYSLIIASRGLEHGHEVSRRRFEAGVARSPHHAGLHRQMLQQVCRKWGGSHEQMHTFARESMLAAPAGSLVGELVAIGHLENWLDISSPMERIEYMTQPRVIEQLDEAAARSIDHPDFAPTTSPYPALNTFAMAYGLAERKDTARALFRRIGDHATAFPWNYGGSPGVWFHDARRACRKYL